MTTRREFLHRAGLLGAAGAFAGAIGPVALPFASPMAHAAGATKTASTLYPADKVAAARRNIAAGHAWAIELRDEAVARAEAMLAQGDDWAWHQITGQPLPRSLSVNNRLGSPITGTEINTHGAYPWVIDVVNRPWKLVDPTVPEDSAQPRIYPTNDFAAFYATALDERGIFDPARGDRSLLVNELYPEMGPTWGVDDGYGWVDDDGAVWPFVAYYNHWGLWVALAGSVESYGTMQRGLAALRDAYLYTGDARYARTGLIILDRIADVYPDMDTLPYGPRDGFDNGSGGNGKAVNRIWEALQTTPTWISSYDAFFPEIATEDRTGVVDYLIGKAADYDIGTKDSIEAIRGNIEDNIVRQIYPNVQIAKVHGNFGMHQAALAMAAVVLDDPDESTEWIDFVFATGAEDTTGQPADWSVTGGNILAKLVDVVDRDGAPDEVAMGYNQLWIHQVGEVADVLAGYQGYAAADLYEHPKYAAMIKNYPALTQTMINRYIPGIGDSGGTGAPRANSSLDLSRLVSYFDRYGDPAMAQLIHLANDNRVDGLYGGIFSDDPTGTQQRIQQIVDERGPLQLSSRNLTGYGLASLRAGSGSAMRAAWTYYGRIGTGLVDRPGGPIPGHSHRDALNLGVLAFGVDLAPELGYPTRTGNNPRRIEWESHTISHNTVLVNAQRQNFHWVGTPHGFAATDRVQYVDTSAPEVYPATSLYRRATAQIAIDADSSYLVDVFRVVGGSEHHFSFHSAEGPVTTEGLDLVPQPTGTYAGPDIDPPADDALTRPDPTGFDWLTRVERDNAPQSGFAVDWKVADTWGVHDPDPDLHLRLTMLSEVDDVALCDGTPPLTQVGAPDSLRYLIAHRGEPIRHLDDDDDGVEFGESWRRYASGLAHGGSYWISMPHTPQASVTLRWTGGQAQVLSSTGHSGQVHGLARVTVDGEDRGVVSWSRPEPQLWGQVIYDTGDLAQGDHTMIITALGEKGEHAGADDVGIRIAFDALRIIPPDVTSQFVSVIEPYVGTPRVRSAVAVPARPRRGTVADHEVAAVRVELDDGRIDYVVHSLRPDIVFDVDGAFLFQGVFGVRSQHRGRPVHAMHHDATSLVPVPRMQTGAPAATGRVVAHTRELSHSNSVTISAEAGFPDLAELVGTYIYIANDGVRNAVYRIEGASAAGADAVELDLGGQTLIRGYIDPEDFEAGYVYDIEVGAAARIPLTAEWEA
ncbi:heparinase II/III domain-containing protein [Propionibacteriaceae bacterium Y2011]